MKKATKAQREAEAHWKKLQSEWDKLPKFARQNHREADQTYRSSTQPPPRGQQPKIQSRTTSGHSTAGGDQLKYTGTKMLGLAVMHKSNTVPVFSGDDAKSIAQMRRN